MSDQDWDTDFARTIGLYLNGDAIPSKDDRGQRIIGDSFLLLFNAHDEAVDWQLPTVAGHSWSCELLTAPEAVDVGPPSESACTPPRSVAVLRSVAD
jgi:glycogen operon protein